MREQLRDRDTRDRREAGLRTGQPELRVLKPLLGLPIAAPRMLAEEVEGRVRWDCRAV